MDYKTETRYDGNGQPYDVRLPIDSNIVSINDLQPKTPLNLADIPQPDITGLLGTTQGAIDYTKSIADRANLADVNLEKSKTDISKLMESLVGKTADIQSANESSGLNSATKQLNELNAQAQSLNREAQAIPLQTQQRNANTGATDVGVAPQTTEALRNNAIKALSIAQQTDIATANYIAAKDKAQQIIDIKYKPIEDLLAIKKQQYEFNKDTLEKIDKKRADALNIAIKKEERDLNDKKNLQDTYSKLAIDGGDSQLASKITALDPQSPNFKQDLAVLQGQIKQNQLEKAQIANIYSQIAERNRNTGTSEDPANIIAYAQQYASTGSIPVGLPKGTFGTVSQIAKDLPKQDGVIVDNNTNIKSSKLTSAQVDAYSAMKDLTVKIQQADDLFKQLNTGIVGGTLGNIFPTQTRQEYNTLKNEIIDLLARARTGAAISANEEKLYRDKIPGTFNQSFFIGTSGDTKLTGLKKSISDKLDTQLKAEGVSMYGFSKIKLGNKEYKVGDIIESNGHQGRINPDGSITPIN